MKKLLLTAYGFSTPWPKEKEKHPQMNQIKNDLIDMNMTKVDFLDVEFEDANKLYDYDLIFLNGGYPFYLLHFLKKSGADRILKEKFRSGSLIVGLSAGSIVMGRSINLMQYLYPEDNRFNDVDLTGLNLTHLQIYPHFKEMLTRDATIKEKISEYENKTGVHITRLNNNQAVKIDNDTLTFLG